MNNMKQIQLALNMFVLDNEDYLPPHLHASYGVDREKWEDIAQWGFMDVSWHHELWDGYLDRNTNVFQCAANREMAKKLKQWRADPRSSGDYLVTESYKEWNWSYGWNDLGEGKLENELGTVPAQEYSTHRNRRLGLPFSDPDYGYLPLKESEIRVPSDMFIIADRAGWRQYDNGNVDVFVGESSLVKSGGLSRRHGKKSNITFMDGHAESLRAEQTLLPAREVARRWNRTNEGIRKQYRGRFSKASRLLGRIAVFALVCQVVEIRLGGFF